MDPITLLQQFLNGTDVTYNTPLFRRRYHAYSPACWNSENKDKLEKGDKIVLPGSAIMELSKMRIEYPIMFQIKHINEDLPRVSHCSVMEFTAPEGSVYMPLWMIDNLGLDPTGGSIIELTTVSLPKGEFVQFQAHETKFALLENPRAVMEKQLRTYSCLTVGDTIQLEFNNHTYKLNVTDVRPKKRPNDFTPYAISIIETDIQVDFQEPMDYKEWESKNKLPNGKNDIISHFNDVSNEIDEKYSVFTNDNNKTTVEEEFGKKDNVENNQNNDVNNLITQNKQSYFKKLETSGSLPLQLKTKNKNKITTSNSLSNIDNSQKLDSYSKPIRGQPLGMKTTSLLNISNSDTSNNKNNSSTKKEEEIVGNMRYIYEVDEKGNRKLIRRLPIKNLPDNKGRSLQTK